MKKLLLVTFLLLSCSFAYSQILLSVIFGEKLNADGVEFGLETGVNSSGISSMETTSRLNLFNLGFYFDLRIKKQWSLSTGVLVKARQGVDLLKEQDLSFLGVEVYPENGEYKQVLNNFLVPVMLRYKFRNHLYIEGGTQLGLMYNSWVEYNSSSGNKEVRIREENTANLNKFDVGAIAGLGYRLQKGNGITIGIKYYAGMLDVYKKKGNTRNSSVFLKVNIPVGAHEKKETLN